MKDELQNMQRIDEKRSWWNQIKHGPKEWVKTIWSSNKQGTARTETHPPTEVTCRVYSKALGRNHELTKITIRTTVSGRRSPEAKAIQQAHHKVVRLAKKNGWFPLIPGAVIGGWPFGDLEFVCDSKPIT